MKPQEVQIFLSYLHGVHDKKVQMYDTWIRDFGYSVWLDKNEIENFDAQSQTEDFDLDGKIAQAVKKSAVLCVLLSQETFLSPRYAQREIRLAMGLHDTESAAPAVVALCLDKSPPPDALQRIAAAVLVDPVSKSELSEALSKVISAKASRDSVSIAKHSTWNKSKKAIDLRTGQRVGKGEEKFAPDTFPEAGITPDKSMSHEQSLHQTNEWFAEIAHVINTDPFESGLSKAEVDSKKYLKDHLPKSAEALRDRDFRTVLEIWSSLSDSEFFRLDHPRWEEQALFRMYMLNGIGDAFIAHMCIGTKEVQGDHQKAGLLLLESIAKCRPFLMGGASSERLAATDARSANIVLLDALEWAEEWKRQWSDNVGVIAVISGLDRSKVEEIFDLTRKKIAEVRSVLLGLENFLGK